MKKPLISHFAGGAALLAALGADGTAGPAAPRSSAPATPGVADLPPELARVGTSRTVEVLGSTMHYVESGEGDPILFVHGQPTSSYLWRNVIPHVSGRGRVIAVDLIGMGWSAKPELEYGYRDHARYLDAFIETLGLDRITIVMHDWGSVLGFDYAMRHEKRVKGLAFLEAMLPPAFPFPSYDALPEPARGMFREFRDPMRGRELLVEQNQFIEAMLPGMVMRELTAEEMDAYRAPFRDPADREPVYRWPNELPIGGEPAHTDALLREIGDWLQRTRIPKLHLYASPGAINPPELAAWTAEHLPNVETVFVGAGLHFVQEDQPEAIGRAIDDWLRRVDERSSRAAQPSVPTEAATTREPAVGGFLIFHSTVRDAGKFQEYAARVGPTLEPFGGRVLLKGKVVDVLSGRHDHQAVGVLAFPDDGAAREWYASDAYQALVAQRDEAGEFTVVGYEVP